MNVVAINRHDRLPRLIERAASALARATTPAEVLDARDQAQLIYTTAKATARLAKMRTAHQAVAAACHRAMGDALEIEAKAEIRLANEYDAAQGRGEVKRRGKPNNISNGNNITLSVAAIGLTSNQIHRARHLRDAEKRTPGTIRKAIDTDLDAQRAPSKASVRRAARPARKPLPCEADPRIDYRSRLVNILLGSEKDAHEFLDKKAPDGIAVYDVFDYRPLAELARRVAGLWHEVARQYEQEAEREEKQTKRQKAVSQ